MNVLVIILLFFNQLHLIKQLIKKQEYDITIQFYEILESIIIINDIVS